MLPQKGLSFRKIFNILIIPFFASRIGLQIIGFLSLIFPINSNYPNYQGENWFFTPCRFLDIWVRWDSGWYYSIVTEGYTPNFDVQNTMSNIAFFPLYPLLIKLSSIFAIDFGEHKTLFTIFALMVSNISLLVALFLIYRIGEILEFSEDTRKTILWLILLYPYGFFFSAAYTESVFLMLLAAVFFFCLKSNWFYASIAGMLLTLTRPLGILVLIPLSIRYLIAEKWKVKIKDVLCFSLIPIALGLFLYYAYTITGEFLAPFHNQMAWGKAFQMPWITIFKPKYLHPIHYFLDITFLFLAIILIISYFLLKIPKFEWAIHSFFLLILPLFSGTLQSTGRYTSVLIPIYFSIGLVIEKEKRLKVPIFILFYFIQAVLFAGWARGYFVV